MQRGMRREEEAPKGCKGVYDWLEEKGEWQDDERGSLAKEGGRVKQVGSSALKDR